MASGKFGPPLTRANFYINVYKAMVQTPLGAKCNPWIAYMKECRINYNAAKASAPIESNEPSMPVNGKTENTNENEIKKRPSQRKSLKCLGCLLAMS